jgi:hypothetical protein
MRSAVRLHGHCGDAQVDVVAQASSGVTMSMTETETLPVRGAVVSGMLHA